MKQKLDEIVLVDGRRIIPDKVTSYGFDKEFFAVIGADLYYRRKKGYELLSKNYLRRDDLK